MNPTPQNKDSRKEKEKLSSWERSNETAPKSLWYGARKIFYRKLIRDRIPEKMTRVGAAYEVKKLKKKEFEKELLKKVGEEASGLLVTKNKEDIIEELADVLDVAEEIRQYWKIKPSCLKKKQKENALKKGGFQKRIYLVWSEDTGYRTNERRYKK